MLGIRGRARTAGMLLAATACGSAGTGRADTDASVSASIGSTAGTSVGDASSTSGSSAGDGATVSSGSGTGADGGDTTDGVKFDLMPGIDAAGPVTYPVRMIPNLVSITFYERSGGDAPTPYTFLVDGPELTTRLDDPLSGTNLDIMGVSTEFYDVYYSDIDGGFELDGRYLSISGVFQYALPAGGGLNLAEIGLDFAGAPTEFGNYVASYVALGDNAAPETVDFTIDGDLQTNTTMGNTIGTAERLRVTLGFESSSGPPG